MDELSPGTKIKLTKFPPNRGIMDWDRVLHIGQIGRVVKTHIERKQDPLYEIWFSSHSGREGYEVWLATEHFETVLEEKTNHGKHSARPSSRPSARSS